MAIRKINRETVSKLADVRLMLEEQLDRSLKKAEEALPAGKKNLVHLVLSVFTSSRSAKVELTAPEILEKLSPKGLDSDDLKNVLSTLMREEVLRVNAQGEYSIAGSLLNRRVYEKIEAQSLLVRKIQNFIRDRFLIYQERSQLLTQSDLNYIEPYLADINLSADEAAFIEKSKNAINREKRRTVIFLTSIIILLTALTTFAFFKYHEANAERKRADEAQEIAEIEADNAKKAKEEALDEKCKAEDARYIAEIEKNRALIAEADARSAETLARESEKEARAAQAEAQRKATENLILRKEAQALAEKMRLLSEENIAKRNIADQNAAEAEKQKLIAVQSARILAELRLITLSRQVAIQLQHDENLSPETKAFLAQQVYFFNNKLEEGDIYYPDIAQAVYEGQKALVKNPNFNRLATVQGMVRSVALCKDGNTIFSAGSGGIVQMWEVSSWDEIEAPNTPPLTILKSVDVINSLAISPDGYWLAAGGRDSVIYLLDISPKARKMKSFQVQKINQHGGREVFDLGFLPDGKSLISTGADFNIRLYDLQNAKSEILATTNERVEAIAFFEDEPAFLFGTTAGEVYRYDVPDRRAVILMKGTSKVTALDVKGNYTKHFVVAGRADGSFSVVHIFQPTGMTLLPRDIQFHSSSISDVEIINDSLFAVASLEGKVSVWNTLHYNKVQYKPMIFNDLDKWATALAFVKNKDSGQLIIGSYGSELKFWNLDPSVYSRRNCAMLKALGIHLLSNEEYIKYFGEDYQKSQYYWTSPCN